MAQIHQIWMVKYSKKLNFFNKMLFYLMEQNGNVFPFFLKYTFSCYDLILCNIPLVD